MSINVNGSGVHIQPEVSTPKPLLNSVSSVGVSGIPSSIQPQTSLNESGSGLCSWLNRLINKIRSFFSRSSSSVQAAPQTAPSNGNIREQKIAWGEQIIDSHFFRDNMLVETHLRHEFGLAPNGECVGVVVLLNYDGQKRVCYGKIPTQQSEVVRLAKEQLQQLLQLIPDAQISPGKLTISTILFKKNNDNFDYFRIHNKDDGSYSGKDRNPCLSPTCLPALFNYLIPERNQSTPILEFLNRL
jgi:hypothetical protein